jgi:hypothetical protein
MDAATRADLIDLMARAIAAVFHEEGRRGNDRLLHPKIKPEHLARKAIVYLRQPAKGKYGRIRKVNLGNMRLIGFRQQAKIFL